MYDATYIEGQGKPVAPLVYKYFSNDAGSSASSRGMPAVRAVFEPIVSECTVAEEIEAGVQSVLDDIVSVLTRPLTTEERDPRPRALEKASRIAFKGDVEEVNRFFYQRGWTDGLPIIPPTEESVARMLTGTDLTPDTLVETFDPRHGKATVEKIAINAVMAGALPTYMPLLIAGLKALKSNPGGTTMTVSTGSWSPFWIVNGPVRKQLDINDSYGALSPGHMANAAIGRALGLMIKNITGIRQGIEDMGVLGNPGKYSMVLAENEEANPWEPLHVESGFNQEDSTISLSFPQTYQQLYSYATDDRGFLDTISYNLSPGRIGLLSVMLTPPDARSLSTRGWTKETMRDYILEHARVPRTHHSRHYAEGAGKELPASEELVPLFASGGRRDPIQIFVAGGYGSWVGLISGGQKSIEKIELPKNWESLVARYKNIVPTYARY